MMQFQADLNNVSQWCTLNKLDLNVNKCKHVSFYRHKYFFHSHYRLLGERLDTLTEIRDLGVLFRHNLSFDRHIDAAVAKAYSMLGFLKRVCRNFSNLKALTSVFCAHVRSHLEYACIVWYPIYYIYSTRIESIQKKFVLFALRRRYSYNLRESLPSYQFRCDILHLNPLDLRRKLYCVLFVFDIFSNKVDACNLIPEFNFAVPRRRLRINFDQFSIPFRRTNFGQSDPIIVMCTLFNMINNHLDRSLDLTSYRSKFKQDIIEALRSMSIR